MWKRFVRVRTDDLESVRVERAIKRVRSDLAAHVGGSPKTPTSAAAAFEEKDKADKENMAPPGADTASIRSQAAPVLGKPVAADQRSFVAVSGKDDDEKDLLATPAAEAVSGTSSPDAVATAVPQHEAQVKGTTPEPTAAEEQEASTPTTASDPSRMHRSQSADPDKSSRLNRVYAVGDTPPPRDQTLSQTGSETSASTGTGAESHSHSRSAKKKRSGSAERSGSNKELNKKLSTRKVVVDDFEMMRVLGKGCAGKVLLVRHKNSGDMFAMKAITKRHVLAHQELQHTLTEQAVLKKMAHAGEDPFVVKLWWSFHDKENLFLVMDFHPGGDLATQLARWGRLGRDRARFYAAEIVEGCEGLHANGVIYRDLKPENILIGADGHIVLTDFGLSKEFARTPPSANTAPATPSGARPNGFYSSSTSPAMSTVSVPPVTPPWMKAPTEKAGDIALGWPAPSTATDSTSTFCGTAEYLAPEVIQGLPYSYQVDWWSFGTMLFEMLTGITPFWANNHSDMYLRVLQDELQFPDDRAMDPDTKSLIRGLLQRNPALRMSEPRIKRHPYFSMIDWTHVYYKRYIPPYIPPIDPANASDTQNFDDTFLGMEPVLDDPNDVQTDTDQERGENTDTDRTDGEDTNTPSQSRSSSVTPADEDVEDVFDGYSFKGRHSVIIDDDDDDDTSEESGLGSEDDEDKDIAGVRDADIENLRDEADGRKEGHVSPSPTPDEVDATEPKTPEARPHALPAEPEPEPARKSPSPVRKSPSPVRESPSPPPKAEVPQQVSPKARRSKDLPPPSSPVLTEPKPRRSKDLPPARFTEELPVTPAKDTRPAAKQRNARQKREKSGVPALDKYLSDAIDEDEDGTGKGLLDDEDDDWDFVEAVEGEERNGARGTSLFARGVVDRYKLAVFRKPTPSQPMRSFSGMSAKTDDTISESPESTRKRGRATMGFKTPRQFLQPKSPSSKSSITGTGGSGSVGSRAGAASTSASLSSTTKSHRMESSTSATLSAASSSQGMLMTPSTSGSGTEQVPRLKNKESEMSMGVESISSDPEHGRGALTDTGAMTDGGKTKDGKPKKKLKRYKQNAEKMFNLFSSPKP